MKPSVVLELAGAATTVGRDLDAGGVFVAGCTLAIYADCDLVVRGAAGEVTVAARVVWVEAGRGAGLELVGFGAQLRARMSALVKASLGQDAMAIQPRMPAVVEAALDAAPPEFLDDEPVIDPLDDAQTQDAGVLRARAERVALNVHERVRGLTIPQQLKLAQTGELNERVALERIYGKAVWEALLRNPRITPPEVARISRMGTLPRPTVEQIVANGAWIAVPEIRRALLSNPRLGFDQIQRVLRVMPKAELKLATIQTAYPAAVRDAARKLFKE